MDKNTASGLLLIGLITIVYFFYTAQQMENAQPAETETPETTEQVSENAEQSTPESYQEQTSPAPIEVEEGQDSLIPEKPNPFAHLGPFADRGVGEEEFTTVETDLLKMVFTNKGGTLYSVELKDYLTYDSLPLILLLWLYPRPAYSWCTC